MGRYSGQNTTAVATTNQRLVPRSPPHDRYTAAATAVPMTR
jgi:hypothetical protein